MEKKCSKSLFIRRYKSKQFWGTTSQLLDWLTWQNEKMINVGDVRELEHSAIWNYAQRATKICIPFDPAILLLELYPKDIIKLGKDIKYTKIFIAALFVVAKNWKSRGCTSIGEWLNKLWCMNGILLCYEKWWTRRLQRSLERLIWTGAEWKEQNQENFVHSNDHSVREFFLVDLEIHNYPRT